MTDAPKNPGDNPMGLDGFEFVEFTSPDPQAMADLFEKMGFTHVGNHRSKNVRRYAQGDINFLLNMDDAGQVAGFRNAHGPSANAMAFRVADAAKALKLATERGAVPVEGKVGPAELNIPAIEGIGGANLYLVDKRGGSTIYDIDFEPTGAGVDDHSVGLHTLDHLTHNLQRGRMDYWANYYESIFNFRQIRYFDIEGQSTGLFSKAMTAPDDKIRIPLNESQDEHSQIEEFIKDYKGEGIQHLALATDDIFATVDALRANGIHAEHLFRPDRQAPARAQPRRRGNAQTRHPDRRRAGNGRRVVAADFHREYGRPDLLRDHPEEG
jgi:4-hydroxyphenylpyruvate dioxygenase